jgi:RNA polymerase sigma-70 factor (ECF subfamily)
VEFDQLSARLRRGDPNAFDQVYAACHARLFRFVLRLCRDEALAEELVQETWLRFAQHARTLPETLEPGAWLFTVSRNLYISQRRRALVRRLGLTSLWHWIAGRTQVSAHELLAASESHQQLEAAIAALPRSQREVLLLVAIEGLAPSQAAKALNISGESARQRLSRARAGLERALRTQASARATPEVSHE